MPRRGGKRPRPAACVAAPPRAIVSRMNRSLRYALGLGAAFAVLAAFAAFLVPVFTRGAEGPAPVWTDVPELALYAELFNAQQSRYRVHVEWKEDLAAALREARVQPALAIGRYLKSSGVRDRFQSLDYLFGELLVNQAAFYPELLALGNIEGRQLLLPVSFDLPAIVFVEGGQVKTPSELVLGMDELAGAAAFNQKKGESHVRMGFSPRWDPEFLVLLARAGGAGFKEGRPLTWSESGLTGAVQRIIDWSTTANGSAAQEEDFQFKYLYTPAYKYVGEGRALFAYMRGSDFFLVPEEKRSPLDFRWFAEGGSIPVREDLVFAAIPRAGKSKPAAEAFLKWFYQEESQRAMLESARRTRTLEGSFGVAEGFSAVRAVNERVFPLYYPALVGHLPPADGLAAPAILPSDWPTLRNKVVAPWLLEATARPAGAKAAPGEDLSARLADYLKRRGD